MTLSRTKSSAGTRFLNRVTVHLTTLEAKIEQGIGRCVNLQEFARLYDSKIYVEPCIAAQYSDFLFKQCFRRRQVSWRYFNIAPLYLVKVEALSLVGRKSPNSGMIADE